MSGFRNFALGLAAVSLIFAASGCKKGENASGGKTEVVAGGLAAADIPVREAGNSLLAFVPENAPLVYASTGKVGMNHPVVQKAMSKYIQMSDLLGKIQKAVKDEDLQKMQPVIDEWAALVKDFNGKAKEFGLHSDHIDYAVYMDDGILVGKVSVADGAKFKEKALNMFKNLPENTLKISDKGEWVIMAPNAEGMPDEMPDTKVAVNYGNNVVTMALIQDEAKIADLGRVLKPADKALKLESLGQIDNDVESLGFIDNVRAVEQLLTGEGRKAIEEMLGDKIPAECDPEIKSIIADYPRINVVTRFSGADRVEMESTMVMADKGALGKLAALHSPSIEIGSDESFAILKLNVNLAKIISQAIEMADTLSKKEYKCEPLAELSKGAKSVPEMITDPQFGMVRNILDGLSGVNVVVDNIDLKTKKFQGLVNVTGDRAGEVLPTVFEFVASEMPDIKKITLGGAVVPLDLTAMVGMDLKLNAYMTKTDFVAATEDFDVEKIAKSERKSSKSFVEFQMGSKFYGSLNDVSDEVFDDIEDPAQKEAIKKDFADLMNNMITQTYTIGTNSDGIATTATFIF